MPVKKCILCKKTLLSSKGESFRQSVCGDCFGQLKEPDTEQAQQEVFEGKSSQG